MARAAATRVAEVRVVARAEARVAAAMVAEARATARSARHRTDDPGAARA